MSSNLDSTKPPRLLIGGVPEHFNLPWHLAIEQNRFAALNVEVAFATYHGGTGEMIRAIADREIDIGLMLTEGCLAGRINGALFKIVKTYVQSPLIWGIHVAVDSDIHTLEQMQGRKYAISRKGSGSHLMAVVDAAERGWKTTDLEFVIVKNLDGARTALASGSADIFLWEKYTTHPYVESNEFRLLGTRLTLWPAFVVGVHDEVLAEHAGLVRDVLNVINQSCAELMQNPNAVDLIAKRYQLKRDQVDEWFKLTNWGVDFEKPTEQLETAQSYLRKLGLVSSTESKAPIVWFDL